MDTTQILYNFGNYVSNSKETFVVLAIIAFIIMIIYTLIIMIIGVKLYQFYKENKEQLYNFQKSYGNLLNKSRRQNTKTIIDAQNIKKNEI